MYGRWWVYYMQARMRHASSQPAWNAQRRKEVAFDLGDDLWIFLRLALVLAIFFAGLACILWIAN
jgi:hypothetical protein